MQVPLSEIIRHGLEQLGAQGLYDVASKRCWCEMNNLMPCEDANLEDCVAAKIKEVTTEELVMEPMDINPMGERK